MNRERGRMEEMWLLAAVRDWMNADILQASGLPPHSVPASETSYIDGYNKHVRLAIYLKLETAVKT